MLLVIPNAFANGTGEANIIDAPKMNANFDQVETVLNGNVEKDNIKPGSAIALLDTHLHISANWQFDSNPTFNAGGIADAALTANIPKKDAANIFSALQKFSAGVDMDLQQALKFLAEKVASLPTWDISYKGRILYNNGDNKFYGANDSTWVDLGYVGGYTGGAVRSYSGTGIADDGDQFKFWFKTEGASPVVKITIKGEPFPKRFYTELAYHTHVFTGTNHNHAITDPTHRHSVVLGSHGHGSTQYAISTHTHGVSGNTGGRTLSHCHWGVVVGSSATDDFGPDTHTHTVSITSGSASASQAIPSENLGTTYSAYVATGITVDNAIAAGTNAYAGINAGTLSSVQKLYGKSLTIKIDGTNVTSNVLSATGWAVIGDGTDSHAFQTTGSGEMTASAWKTYTAGFHTLEIIEPESGYGCSLLVHIETS